MEKIAPVLYKCISMTKNPRGGLSKAFFSSLHHREQISKPMYYNPLVECESTTKYLENECLFDTIEELELKLLHKTKETKCLIDKIENLEKKELNKETIKKYNMDIFPAIITAAAFTAYFW
jgi:hypothetical protein